MEEKFYEINKYCKHFFRIIFAILIISFFLALFSFIVIKYLFYGIIPYPEVLDKDLINWTSALVISTIALVVATFLLGIIAVFQDVLRSWFWCPIIECELDILSPTCNRSLIKPDEKEINENYKAITEGYGKDSDLDFYRDYFRLKILNKGKVSAKNVEVILKDVKDVNGKTIGLSSDNLLWSTYEYSNLKELKPIMYWDYISPGTHQYCSLGFIDDPSKREYLKVYENLKSLNKKAIIAYEDETIFAFNVYWKTYDPKYFIPKGVYFISLVIGCENARHLEKEIKIEVIGKWATQEKDIAEVELKKL